MAMVDVRMTRELLEGAGRLAMNHYMKVAPLRKANRSYVTDADFAVQAYLKKALEAQYPNDGIIAEEENLRQVPRSGNRYWIIDPIDGTASFVAGLPVWGVALGLVEDGRPVAGFFWIPVMQDFFYTTLEGIVYRNGRPTAIRAPESLHNESLMLAHGGLHKRYTISPQYPGKVRGMGSAIAHLCYVATGSANVALIPQVYIWDIAAGMALLLNNGGAMQYLNGENVSLADLFAGNPAPYPMLCGHPDAIAQYAPFVTFQASDR